VSRIHADTKEAVKTPVVAFFNSKGGVGKTSLVYHTSWMLSELGVRTLAVDLDPQANLTAAFLDEDELERLWEAPGGATTIYRCVRPLLDAGDLQRPEIVSVTPSLGLLPGDLGLARFGDELAAQWPRSLGDAELYRAFRLLTAFWHAAQDAARQMAARVILLDVGPNLGPLNRAALLASDFVVIPLTGDLFSIQELRNLGPTLRAWRSGWEERRANWEKPEIALPAGAMKPVGYVIQQHDVLLHRPVKAYTRWLDRVPAEYRRSVLGLPDGGLVPPVLLDPECLAMVKHFRSLMPMAQEARRPVFLLRPADGAAGSHAAAVQSAYQDFSAFAEKLLDRIGMRSPPP
jgi:chromosome partitioning protein